jgi:hypothetical protein
MFVVKKERHVCFDIVIFLSSFFFDSLLQRLLLTVYIRVKVQVDLQAGKSSSVVKGPFFPRVMNPRYRILGAMRDARVDLVKPRNFNLQEVKPMHLILKNITRTNLIY